MAAAILLGAVAAAGGAYAVHRITEPLSVAPVTGHVAVATTPPSLSPLDDAGPGGTLPPRPVTAKVNQVVVPILLYHYVRVNRHGNDHVGFNLSVTPEHFAEQMALLVATGAHTVTLADLVAALHGGPPLPPRPVILTFDDGYSDFYTAALPVLQRDRLRAISFVVSGFVDKPGYMTAAQVRSIVAAGMVVGDHTVHHVALGHLSLAEAQQEIQVSRQQLVDLTQSPVDDFAYPYGDWNPGVVRLVQQAGFREAVSTDLGNVHDLTQLFVLRRIRIGGTDTLASFAEKAGVPIVPLRPPSPSPTSSVSGASPQPQPSPGTSTARSIVERRAA